MALMLGFVADGVLASVCEVAAWERGGGNGDRSHLLDDWECSREDERSGDEA
jgi:hypothetical protein